MNKKAPDAGVKDAVNRAIAGVLRAEAQLFDKAKGNRGDARLRQDLADEAEKVAQAINELLVAMRRLPDMADVKVEEKPSGADLDALAESELVKASKVIEDTTRQLQYARPKRTPKVAGEVTQDDINDAIVDAASAISQATGALVNSAAVAQQERVKIVRETPGGSKFAADPAWANGLISAAQNVSGSVANLGKVAQESVKEGKIKEETLVAAAKSVATATAHLVASSRAKADPDSKAQQALKNAAQTVSIATQQLVDAAAAAARFQNEVIVEEVDFGETTGKAAELEQQMKILKLEKELNRARTILGLMKQSHAKK